MLVHEHEALTSKYSQLNAGNVTKFGGYCLINGFEIYPLVVILMAVFTIVIALLITASFFFGCLTTICARSVAGRNHCSTK